MILRALFELAEREQLMQNPDFPLAPVGYLVTVSADGEIVSIVGTHTEVTAPVRRVPRRQPRSLPIPRQPGRTSGDRAFFLVDKSEYVFGMASGEGTSRSAERLVRRATLFRELVADCAAQTGDDGVRAVLKALEDLAAGRQRIELPRECASNDLFAFVYAPDIDRPVHLRPAVAAYWRRLRSRTLAAAETGTPFVCIVTGEPVPEPGLFPKVKHVPGGQTSGTPLVSFNASAFTSYGLADNANAPISRAAAEACATALQRLLHPAFPDPGRPDESLPRRNLRLSDDTVVCYWASSPGAAPLLNSFAAFFEPDAGEVGESFRSIWRGRPAHIRDPGSFYALTISGAQGRMIVRDWFASSVTETAQHLADHFAVLDIVRNTPAPKDGALPEVLPLRTLLSALAPNGRHDAIPPSLAAQFVSAALRGTPYPIALLQRALERARAEAGRSEWADHERRDARAALIKAVLSRRPRSASPSNPAELTVALDTTNTSPGYLCGRLMALLERLQQAALGDVNAGIVDRYFGAASATPRIVLVRLLRTSKHHERKAQDNPKTAGLAVHLKSQIDDIASLFDPSTGGFPTFLPIEEQGLFILGYHQQRHALWTRKPEVVPETDRPAA